MIRSSKSTIHYIRLHCILQCLVNKNRKYRMNLNEMIALDLPSLQSIDLDQFVLQGNYDYSCKLIMRSNNELKRND